MSDLKKTPLIDQHRAAGARLVEFAGYEMPVQYQGVIAESLAVREGAGMFDVSHMARLTFRGAETLAFLEQVTTNDVAKLTDGTGQYSMLPNAQGGVVDDIIVYRIGEETYKMVVNASNHEKDVAHLRAHLPAGVGMTDQTEETAMIAVQGPNAAAIVTGLAQDKGIADLGMFGTIETEIGGVACFAARSGYTGEDGFELICGAAEAGRLWDALAEAGVVPCGLGSRDTLRVEAGLPLYGHELSDEMSPMCAGLGWVISKTKSFLGSEEINRVRAEGAPLKLQGIALESKRVAQIGAEVTVDGRVVGTISSGVYSPLLGRGVAFAFLEPDVKQGTACTVDFRGKAEPGTVANKRFFKRDSA